MPKVSVIIPVYNPGKYFEECVRSLMEQTLDELELLFIDDGSTDGSMDTLRRIVNEYPDTKKTVRIIQNETNIGCCASRKKGIDLAQGQYIGFCDHDDFCDKEMFKTLYAKAAAEDLDMVYCDTIWKYDTEDKYIPYGCENEKTKLMRHCLMGLSYSSGHGLWNRITKRSIISNKDVEFAEAQIYEDRLTVFECIYNSEKFGYVSEPLYTWRQVESSVSHNFPSLETIKKKRDMAVINTNALIDFIKRHGLDKTYKNEIISIKLQTKEYKLNIGHPTYAEKVEWNRIYPHLLRDFFLRSSYPLRFKFGFLKKYIKMCPLTLF